MACEKEHSRLLRQTAGTIAAALVQLSTWSVSHASMIGMADLQLQCVFNCEFPSSKDDAANLAGALTSLLHEHVDVACSHEGSLLVTCSLPRQRQFHFFARSFVDGLKELLHRKSLPWSLAENGESHALVYECYVPELAPPDPVLRPAITAHTEKYWHFRCTWADGGIGGTTRLRLQLLSANTDALVSWGPNQQALVPPVSGPWLARELDRCRDLTRWREDYTDVISPRKYCCFVGTANHLGEWLSVRKECAARGLEANGMSKYGFYVRLPDARAVRAFNENGYV